nr:hypothetical protein BDOA9_0123120 [Bradyrhizobium sp. DOA9]
MRPSSIGDRSTAATHAVLILRARRRRASRRMATSEITPRCERPARRHKAKQKSPVDDGALRYFADRPAYLRLVEIELNLAFSVVPRLLTTVMIASAMPAAIRPYSMAVAPDSSFKKRATRFFIECSK